ncbi:MAG: exosome complex protein Rrp42 [Candidatus Aenigmarchaeota archaeon]|nr:exosome complex protein Rrp42 [Candidatus Aenigmarchaeota archaeon]
MNENYTRKLAKEGKRADGRSLDQFREIKLETNVIKSAEGSARIKLGNTQLLVGVKAKVMEPYPDTPNEGTLIVDTELVPIASPEFETGPPGEKAVEIARVVDRGIRECKAVDFEKLCIAEGEAVWCLNIDIHVINFDGNILDAAGLGAIAALMTAKLPKYDIENKKIDYNTPEAERTPLPLKDFPLPITILKISDKLLVDPSDEEEKALDARLTITSTKNGDLCAMQKGGKGFFTKDEAKQAADISIEKGKKLRKLLK